MTDLLMVFLRGGADGLSLAVPTDDPAYEQARPTLRIDPVDTLPLERGLGLHPAARRLHGLWEAGSLAVVPAVGSAGQTRSHFEAQADLERAGGAAGTGWIGRHLAATAGTEASPFRAIAVDTVGLPPTLWGTGDALATPDPTTISLGGYRRRRDGRGVTVVPSRLGPDPAHLAQVWDAAGGVTGAGALAALGVLETVAADPVGAVDEPAAFGSGPTAAAFAAASAVVAADLGTEVVMVNVGGWDTHVGQGDGADGTFTGLLASLDEGLGETLARHPALTALVLTEFGRRVAENSSGGTDHGKGSVALVAGHGVNGGVAGEWPGLTELDDGDVPVVNDIGAVVAEVALDVLATPDVEVVVPGAGSLGLLDVVT